MHRVLVVAAHPDDELLGAGGTLIKHAENGDCVRTVLMCEGESLRYGKNSGQDEAISEAAQILGISRPITLGYPDQRLDTYTLTELIRPLEEISREYRPDIVYCQWGGDANRDHQIVFEAANIAFRPLDGQLTEFYCFYTVSSTEWAYPRSFVPDTWSDISGVLERKIHAFQCYKSEVRAYPHPRSVKALEFAAHFWGNQCCLDAAEAFMTIRRILK